MILHYSSLMSLRFKCAIETKKIIEKLKEGNIDPSYRFSQMKEQREQIEKWKPHGNNILYSYSHYYVEFGTRTSSLVLARRVWYSCCWFIFQNFFSPSPWKFLCDYVIFSPKYAIFYIFYYLISVFFGENILDMKIDRKSP